MTSTTLLSVNLKNSLPQNKNPVQQKTMTTKELATVLNVDVSTIQKTVQRLNATSDILPKYNQGQTPRFTEEQATLIKQEIQKHHNLATRQIDSVSTQVEENQIVMKAMAILQNRNNELMAQLNNMQPKAVVYDELVDRSKTMNFRDMAAKLGFTQTEFMAILIAKYVYKNSIGEYRARAEYQKYFTLRTFNKSTDKTGEQLLLNMEGITYFINKYKPGAVADSFIEKGEEEYQKIINKTSEKFIESVESHSYTLKEASVILDIPENMIKEYLQIRHFADFTGKKTILANEYIDDENKITEKGIEKLSKAFDIYLRTKKGTYYNPNGECNGKEE